MSNRQHVYKIQDPKEVNQIIYRSTYAVNYDDRFELPDGRIFKLNHRFDYECKACCGGSRSYCLIRELPEGEEIYCLACDVWLRGWQFKIYGKKVNIAANLSLNRKQAMKWAKWAYSEIEKETENDIIFDLYYGCDNSFDEGEEDV